MQHYRRLEGAKGSLTSFPTLKGSKQVYHIYPSLKKFKVRRQRVQWKKSYLKLPGVMVRQINQDKDWPTERVSRSNPLLGTQSLVCASGKKARGCCRKFWDSLLGSPMYCHALWYLPKPTGEAWTWATFRLRERENVRADRTANSWDV